MGDVRKSGEEAGWEKYKQQPLSNNEMVKNVNKEGITGNEWSEGVSISVEAYNGK